mmetsp:Transcript_76133/g.214412  ORF Transcript_76133/g.214412 Transcript_76133/m.214412 type:complete len:165 (+) Transcript_76133:98-592(+)
MRILLLTAAMMLDEISEHKDDYKKLWGQCGICPKLGMHEDSLLRWNSSGYEQITLQEHIGRMKEGQNDTHYITGESVAVVTSSAFWETPRLKCSEVQMFTAISEKKDDYTKIRELLGMTSVCTLVGQGESRGPSCLPPRTTCSPASTSQRVEDDDEGLYHSMEP